MSSEPRKLIEIENLVTHYGARKILKGVSLDVHEGEIMVMMGRSGSGKSTLLRHILGLETPTSGAIRILGQDIGRLGMDEAFELRRKLGVAFQGGALFSSMPVGENIILPLVEHTKLDRNTMMIMARMKLEVVKMAGFENLMPSELSGGMLKRAALARAIIMDPTILFCDEPGSGLDPMTADALDDLILHLREATGMTIVVVAHEVQSAFKIADRIAVMDHGEILFVGSVAEVRNHPSERIQNLLQRQAEDDIIDPEDYLRRLMGEGRLEPRTL